MTDFQFTGVEVLKGTYDGDPTPRYFVNAVVNDGSTVVMDMKLSHFEARQSAKEIAKDDELPIVDHTIGR